MLLMVCDMRKDSPWHLSCLPKLANINNVIIEEIYLRPIRTNNGSRAGTGLFCAISLHMGRINVGRSLDYFEE